MEKKNEELKNKLLLINNKILDSNDDKRIEAIQELYDLIYKKQNEKIEIKNYVEKRKSSFQDIFNISIKYNLLGIFRYIIINHEQEIDINAKYNNQPLVSLSCLEEKDEIFETLLSSEKLDLDSITYIDLNLISYIFWTACVSGRIDYAELIYKKAKIYNKSFNPIVFDKIFFYLYNVENINVLKFVLSLPEVDNYEYNKPFVEACSSNIFETLKLFYEKGNKKININEYSSDGKTALYYACKNGNIELVKFLISKKEIDINKADCNGKTPFDVACENGYFDIAEMLYNKQDFNRKEENLFDKEKGINFNKNIIELEIKYKESNQFKISEIIKCSKDQKTKIVYTAYNLSNNRKIYECENIAYNLNNDRKIHESENYEKYLDKITYFIGNRTFTATIDVKSNIKFDFTNLEGMTSIDFEREINKILNSFKKVDSFDTYLSWIPLALIEFKKQEKQRESKDKQYSNIIEFFYIHRNMNKIKEIIDNDLKNKEDKILVCDFSFSPGELEIKDKAGHAIPLVIFNSKDINNNPKTKILAFNTGFKSKKAFKKLKKILGDNVEIIKVDKDIYQKNGSCNISPKPIIEAIFSSGITIEQYTEDIIMLKKLRKLRKQYINMNCVKKFFLKAANYIKNKMGLKTSYQKEKEKLLKNININEFLKRLQKYKEINIRLVRDYPLLYSSGGIYVTLAKDKNNNKKNEGTKIKNKNNSTDLNNDKIQKSDIVWKKAFSLNKDLDNSIKEIDETISEVFKNRASPLKLYS